MEKEFALITGASGGIGRAISLQLAKEGYSLYLHFHRNETAIQQLLEEISSYGGEYIPIQADLSNSDGYKKLTEQIFSIDAIIHNGGMGHYGLFTDIDKKTTETLLQTHVTSPLLITKELLPKMIRKKRGNIVVITSIWGQTGASCEVLYSTVKGAQISFVKALSKEVALNGIRVNGVAPGAISTPMLSIFTEEELEAIREEIPMGKLGTPEHVADAVSFLLSEKSSYITGQIISVNGGWYT